MTTAYEVPLKPQAQRFTIRVAGKTYTFELTWNYVSQVWILNIYDQLQTPLLTGVPLVTGVDLLDQFTYLGFGFALVAQTDHAPEVPPTYLNLGSEGHLFALLP